MRVGRGGVYDIDAVNDHGYSSVRVVAGRGARRGSESGRSGRLGAEVPSGCRVTPDGSSEYYSRLRTRSRRREVPEDWLLKSGRDQWHIRDIRLSSRHQRRKTHIKVKRKRTTLNSSSVVAVTCPMSERAADRRPTQLSGPAPGTADRPLASSRDDEY